MPAPPSSQGSTVSFNGTALGSITRWRAAPSSAVYVEKTNITSPVSGTGANARVRKHYDCVAIDPGTVEVTLFGVPAYVYADSGFRATLAVTWSGGSLSLPAFLDSFEVTGQVGQFLTGQAVFRLTGDAS